MKFIAPAMILSSIGAAKFWASALTAPLDGYGVTIPEWEVEVSPGGPLIKVNGTIQEVRSELLRLNSDWDTHYLTNNTKESPSLNKRAFDVSGHFCGGRWDYCSTYRIDEGIIYLRGVRGQPSLGPGPGNCARVSCSWNSAIWWCNDDPTGKTIQGGFGDIADGAQYLVNKCAFPGQWSVMSGQVFATSNWNVIVRGDRC